MRVDSIRTERFYLVPMTPESLAASLRGDRSRQELLLGASVPKEWPDEPRWAQRRLDELREDADLQPWLLRAIVLRAASRMVGHIGFHTRPGAKYLEELAPGGVEFGYTVFEKERRRGYAREACKALMQWAYRTHRVTRFVVSISRTNVPSLELARGLGFTRIGSHVDEEDGPEDIFERRIGADLESSEAPL